MRNHPLTSMQRNALERAPRDWTIMENTEGFGPTIGTLVSRGLVERKKLGDSTLWRRTPLTFVQAVRNLLAVLPNSEHALRTHSAACEIREVQRQLDLMVEREVAASEEYGHDEIAAARHLLRAD